MLQSENGQYKASIEDLEMKNRLLVDKLNSQIYQQASVYKEKTMHALMNGGSKRIAENKSTKGSQSPLRAGAATSNSYGLPGSNESAFARSPLQANTRPSF
jgi:hypothetical protein